MKTFNQKKQLIHFRSTDEHTFQKFISSRSDSSIYDLYESLYKDYVAVSNPKIYFLPPTDKARKLNQLYKEHLAAEGARDFQLGSWIVTQDEVFHLIEQDAFLKLRTVRNRNIITWDEQKKLYFKKIVLVGLSVGSNVALNLVRMGVGNSFTLIDYDSIDSHNLNRTPYTLRDMGQPKLNSLGNIINGIDPYIDLNLINTEVVHLDNSINIAAQDMIIDAFDHFEGKIELRKQAKKYKKPVVSGWDVGDGMVLIVERYDLDDKVGLEVFLNNTSIEEVLKPASALREKIDIFIKIIGKETHDDRMLASVYAIGQELTGVPQTIIATSFTSAVFTKVICDILLNKSRLSFRKYLDLNTLIY